MENLIGRKISGRYIIEELIGQGGMAQVYKAECETLKRKVAVKVLLSNLEGDAEVVNNFNKEAQAAARLSHNNIVSVYDVGEDDGMSYMVMELVDGITLKEYIIENGPLTWQEACDFCIQIGQGLTEAHAHDVVHRDIKPQNIIMTKDKVLKVTDFGIAKAAGGATVTMGGGNAVGSVHYISPEQARGGYTDARSDIYSLGAVLYEMLTGKVPFDGDTAVAIALMHIEKPVPDVTQINPDIPHGFKHIIEKAMAKEQYARYESVSDMVTDLRAVLSGQSIVESDDDFGATRVRKFDEHEFEKERERRQRFEDVAYDKEETRKKVRKTSRKKQKTQQEKDADKAATILAILTVVLIIAIAFGGYSLMLRNSGQIRVPDLVDMTYDEAVLEMTEKGLKIADEVEYSLSDDISEGRIISQNPEAGDIIKSNQEVTIVVSIGSSGGNIAVPNVVGDSADSAIAAIIDADLSYEIKEEESQKVSAGNIIRQNPAAGTKVNKDEVVIIYMSTGKPIETAVENVTVPKLVNYTLSEAKSILETNNLRLGDNIARKESDLPEGTVISQSPVAGEELEAGSSVNVVISSGSVTGSENEVITSEPTPDTESEIKNNETSTTTKTYKLSIKDEDGDQKAVKVKIYKDGDIIYERIHQRGQTVSTDITGSGDVLIEAYIDDVLVDHQIVDFG